MWDKIKNRFSKGKPEDLPPAANADTIPKGSDQNESDEQPIDIGALFEAVLQAKDPSDHQASTISELRQVANSPKTLPELRAFALFALGEIYLKSSAPGDKDLARTAFDEFIAIDLGGTLWMQAVLYRAMIDASSDDPQVLDRALEDINWVLASPLLQQVERYNAGYAHSTHGFLMYKAGDTRAAIADCRYVVHEEAFAIETRWQALGWEVDWLISTGNWRDAAKDCLDVLHRMEYSPDLLDSADELLGRCFDNQDSSSVIELLNHREEQGQLSWTELGSIYALRTRAYGIRRLEGDIQRQIDEWDQFLEQHKRPSSLWALATVRRHSTLLLHGFTDLISQDLPNLEAVSVETEIPDHFRASALLYLGLSCVDESDSDSLRSRLFYLNQALGLSFSEDHEWAYALLNRGQAYANLGMVEEAMRDLSELIESPRADRPYHLALAYYERGRLVREYQRQEKSPLALADLKKAIEFEALPAWHRARAYCHIGTYFSDQGELEQACAELTVAYGLSDEFPDLRFFALLERAYAQRKLFPLKSIEDFGEIIRDEEIPSHLRAVALSERAKQHMILEMYALAKPDLDAIIQLDDVEPLIRADCLYLRAIAIDKAFGPEHYIEDLRTALSHPALRMNYRFFAHYYIAHRYFEEGDNGRGLAECETILLLPELPDYLRVPVLKLMEKGGGLGG